MTEPDNQVRLKVMSAGEVADVIELTNKCFGEETPVAFATQVFEDTKDDPNQIYLNAYLDNRLVGHLKITIIPTIYEKMNTYAILNHVCVDPEVRRRHIATRLLDEAFRICKERNVKTVELWSNNIRQAAHACYKKYGFEVADAKFFACDVE